MEHLPVIIGSVALKYRLEELRYNNDLEPKDHDIIVRDVAQAQSIIDTIRRNVVEFTYLLYSKSKKFGTQTRAFKADGKIFELTWPLDSTCTTADILTASSEWTQTLTTPFGIECKVAPLNLLYSLKWSHRFLKNSPHFLKTMTTIKNLQRIDGIDIWDTDWVERRMKETYDYAHPNLNVGKGEFFNSNFNYVYDHDSIHEAVKVLDKPAYTYYMDGNAEVNCSKETFFALPRAIRLLGVLEEAYVLAIERSQVPNDFSVDPRKSFNIALEKVCTSITSGWFRQFAWDNYELVQQMYDSIYVDKFKLALQKGTIKPYKGE